jgi:hypothetical protein
MRSHVFEFRAGDGGDPTAAHRRADNLHRLAMLVVDSGGVHSLNQVVEVAVYSIICYTLEVLRLDVPALWCLGTVGYIVAGVFA